MEITYSRDGVAIGGGGELLAFASASRKSNTKELGQQVRTCYYTHCSVLPAPSSTERALFSLPLTIGRFHADTVYSVRTIEWGKPVDKSLLARPLSLSLSSSLLHRTCSVLMTRRILFNPMFLSNRLQVMRLLPLMDAK